LGDNIDKMKVVAQCLLEEETLDAERFAAIMADDDNFRSGKPPRQGKTPGRESSEEDQDIPPRVVPPSTAPLPA
jgi:hypothetical protein